MSKVKKSEPVESTIPPNLSEYLTEQFTQINNKLSAITLFLEKTIDETKKTEAANELIQQLIHSHNLNKVVEEVRKEFPLPEPTKDSSKSIIIEKHDEFNIRLKGDTFNQKHLIKEASGRWVSDIKLWMIDNDKLDDLLKIFEKNNILFINNIESKESKEPESKESESKESESNEPESELNEFTLDMFREE